MCRGGCFDTCPSVYQLVINYTVLCVKQSDGHQFISFVCGSVVEGGVRGEETGMGLSLCGEGRRGEEGCCCRRAYVTVCERGNSTEYIHKLTSPISIQVHIIAQDGN